MTHPRLIKSTYKHVYYVLAAAVAGALLPSTPTLAQVSPPAGDRTRISIDDGWRFTRGDPEGATGLLYDARAATGGGRRGAPPPVASGPIAKAWILPSGDAFLKDGRPHAAPTENLGNGLPYLAADFNDASWQTVDLPHDYAIDGPFSTQGGGGMGRLPTTGAAWYRKSLSIPAADGGKSLFLDIDGAMSYSEVWLNGQFVGGWPYGFSSFRLNLTPFAKPGQANELAIRLDNAPNSARWYTGAGINRNIWLVANNKVHVGQWGTHISTPQVSAASAQVAITTTVDNDSKQDADVSLSTDIYELDANDQKIGPAVASGPATTLKVPAGGHVAPEDKLQIANPKLWHVGGKENPSRYVAVTTVRQNGNVVDTYQTPFGVRTIKYDANTGLSVNGEHMKINGVCDHSDYGALGTAFNVRAAQRQLEILQEMGCNALRTAHNPPAPEVLDLCDKMGMLVMDESFDCWQQSKSPGAANGYNLLFDDWHEQDLRAMLRRDRNHPSIILWSIGNEVGEQGSDNASGDKNGIAKMLTDICHQEDPTRLTVSAMNAASPTTTFVGPIDAIGLNYQGAGLNPLKRPGRRATAQYPAFHQAFPDKFILGSETAASFSSRGFYAFPVADYPGLAAANNAGETPGIRQVSSYDMYYDDFSYIPDKEFAAEDRYPYVAGQFVWSGFDYLGEPTPFNQSRSSYYGILDMAGFRKDRFYLYQAQWRPELPMVHVLPHWNWPDRVGQQTPVEVYTSGDEAELFLNGKSLGKKKKGEFEYRLRWDDVTYQPGELKVVAYKDGKQWATDSVKTTGAAAKLLLAPDRATIAADGKDLSFVTLTVADKDGVMAPQAMNAIHFDISGPGEIVATDNGDATDMTAFPSHDRKAFNGLALAIVRAKPGQTGAIIITAKSDTLAETQTTINAK